MVDYATGLKMHFLANVEVLEVQQVPWALEVQQVLAVLR